VFEEKSERLMPGFPVVTWLFRIADVPANCVVPSLTAPSTCSVLLVPRAERLHDTYALHGQPDDGAVVAQAMIVVVTPELMPLIGAPRLQVIGAARIAVLVPHAPVVEVRIPAAPVCTQRFAVSPLSVILVVAVIVPGAMNVAGIDRVGAVPPLDVI
jgi:hypothetical protein